MKRLCYLGILKEGFSPYSSPVMLISRKLTKDKRSGERFQTFKCKNSKERLSLPLVERHILSIGKIQMWSTISPRFKRCIPFSEIIRKFQEILQCIPIFWQYTIPILKNAYGIKHIPLHMAIIHQCYPQKFTKQEILWNHYGWCSFVYTIKRCSYGKIRRLIKDITKEWIKDILKEVLIILWQICSIWEMRYSSKQRISIKPLRSRLEAIQKLQPPTTAKGCRSFMGMVNFLSMFCPELQKLLKPIYDLTRKGRPFV